MVLQPVLQLLTFAFGKLEHFWYWFRYQYEKTREPYKGSL